MNRVGEAHFVIDLVGVESGRAEARPYKSREGQKNRLRLISLEMHGAEVVASKIGKTPTTSRRNAARYAFGGGCC
jgi:hypothetical protein